MFTFPAKIGIIGINPYVLLPEAILLALFKQAEKEKSPIAVKMTINGHAFAQNLVKYSGQWRLYLNTPMREAAGIDTGDTGEFEIEYDPEPFKEPMHEGMAAALNAHPSAKEVFDRLPPSLQKEIMRYINRLKSEEAVKKNIERAIRFLLGNERFIGRDKPA